MNIKHLRISILVLPILTVGLFFALGGMKAEALTFCQQFPQDEECAPVAPPPSPQVCSSPLTESRTLSCPSGTTGTWTQQRDKSAYPSCSFGAWYDTQYTCADNPPPPPPPSVPTAAVTSCASTLGSDGKYTISGAFRWDGNSWDETYVEFISPTGTKTTVGYNQNTIYNGASSHSNSYTLTAPGNYTVNCVITSFPSGHYFEAGYQYGNSKQVSFNVPAPEVTLPPPPPPPTPTASITINACAAGGSWTLSGGSESFSSGANSSPITAHPPATGQAYTFAYTPPTGYTVVTNPSSQVVWPSGTYTFAATCTQQKGTITDPNTKVTISVSTNPGATWAINPGSITGGTSASPNTGSYTLDPNTYTVSTQSLGTGYTYLMDSTYCTATSCSPTTRTIQAPTTKTLAGGDSLSVNIIHTLASTPAPSVTVTPSPATITSGQSSTITWSSTNASSCSAWWTSKTTTSGTQVVSPVLTTAYPMTCTGSGGSASGQGIVTVNAPTTASLSVSSNVSTTWTIAPGSLSGSGTSGNYTVTPGTSGTTYTVTPATLSGYTSAVSPVSSQVFPGDAKNFTITYTAGSSFDYTLSNNGNLTMIEGGIPVSNQRTITRTLTSGTGQAVDLSLTSSPALPSGVSYSFTQQSCTPTCASALTLIIQPNSTAGTYAITVTGNPLGKTTTFNLTIQNSTAITATCVASPSPAIIGQPVTWTATPSGGTGLYTSYAWSGAGIPTSPAPSTNPYTVTYTTVGLKTANVTISDNLSNRGSCNGGGGTVQVDFKPKFEEF